jgi:hypothetical protein
MEEENKKVVLERMVEELRATILLKKMLAFTVIVEGKATTRIITFFDKEGKFSKERVEEFISLIKIGVEYSLSLPTTEDLAPCDIFWTVVNTVFEMEKERKELGHY